MTTTTEPTTESHPVPQHPGFSQDALEFARRYGLNPHRVQDLIDQGVIVVGNKRS